MFSGDCAAFASVAAKVKKVCEAATQLTRAEIGLAWTCADGEAKYALCGAKFDEAQQVSERQRELTSTHPAFALQRALRIDDVQRAQPAPNLGPLAGITRIASYLVAPVRGRRGDVIGGIALACSRPRAFDVRAQELVTGLASLTATAIESARLFREAHELMESNETFGKVVVTWDGRD
jgi:GAF domain-containing protein